MLALLAFLWLPDYLWHPLHGNGYQWWSGLGSDFGEYTIALALVGGILRSYRQHECHVESCWRPAWHPDPKHGHPVCRRHHSQTGRCVADPDGGSMILEEE